MKPFPVQVDSSTFLPSAPNISANMLALHHVSVIVKQDHVLSANKGVIVKHAFFLLFSSLHSLHCHSLSLFHFLSLSESAVAVSADYTRFIQLCKQFKEKGEKGEE